VATWLRWLERAAHTRQVGGSTPPVATNFFYQMEKLVQKVIKTIDKYSLFSHRSKVLVALSGGPDSVTLLHVLLKIKGIFDVQLAALHVNHMLRGEESERDENFVKELCKSWKVSMFVVRVNVPLISRGKNVEAVARKERYKKFREVLEKWGGNCVALGHTASDLAETVILNLTKGTGIKGLRGFLPKREVFVRPLFEVTREEVEVYVKENNLPFVVDSSNFQLNYERNLIRHKVIPVLKEINPSFERSILKTSEILRGLEDFLDKFTDKFLELNLKEDNCLSLKALKELHPFLISEVVRKAYKKVAGRELSFEKITSVLKILEGHGYREVHTHGRFKIFKNQESLCFGEKVKKKPFHFFVSRLPATVETPLFKLKFCENSGFPILPLEEFKRHGIVVRTRKPGDKLEVNGIKKKLKKVLIEKKFPASLRNILPVVESNGRIIFIPGLYSSKVNSPEFVGVYFEPQTESTYWRRGNKETS
jgi:tRNA(Ile)-lysidine synthase